LATWVGPLQESENPIYKPKGLPSPLPVTDETLLVTVYPTIWIFTVTGGYEVVAGEAMVRERA
jgi:hypothetical protein